MELWKTVTITLSTRQQKRHWCIEESYGLCGRGRRWEDLGVVQSLRHFWLFAIPWTAARQASLSITNSQSLLKLMSIELVMPSNHLILCHPLLLLPSVFPSIKVFSNESVLCISGQSIRASAPVSVLPKNIQDWFPLQLTGWSPCSPRDSQESLKFIG